MTEKRARGKVRPLLSRLAALGFAGWCGLSVTVDRTDLPMLPYFDCRATEPPRAANAEARDSAFAEQAINRGRMYAEVRRQLRDCKNFFRGCHHITPSLPLGSIVGSPLTCRIAYCCIKANNAASNRARVKSILPFALARVVNLGRGESCCVIVGERRAEEPKAARHGGDLHEI